MKPTISIIIATFIAAKTLKNCLNSIVLQKSVFIELLVIDGGSSDETNAILAEYGSDIEFLISEKDRGIYDAWNKGLNNARGEWILFIGADDTLEIDAIAKYLAFLEKNNSDNIDYICAKNTYIDKNGLAIKIFGNPWMWKQFRRNMNVAHVASLHKRTLFQEVGQYDLRFRIAGDYELLLRKKEHLRCLFIDTCIARMATGGTSYSIKALREAYKIRKLHSGLSSLTLSVIYLWQVLLFLRHRILH